MHRNKFVIFSLLDWACFCVKETNVSLLTHSIVNKMNTMFTGCCVQELKEGVGGGGGDFVDYEMKPSPSIGTMSNLLLDSVKGFFFSVLTVDHLLLYLLAPCLPLAHSPL